MGVPLASILWKRAWVALPLLLAGSGVALLAEPASPAAAATRSPAVQLCVLNVTCVNVGPTPSATASTTPPLLGINIGTGASTAPALPSVSVGASAPVVPVKAPSTSVQVTVPAGVVAPSTDSSSSADDHDAATTQQGTVPSVADDSTDPSVVPSFGTVNGAASASTSPEPQVGVVPPTASPRAPITQSSTAASTPAAVQAVAPTTVRPVAVSPKLIQHVVSHSVGGVLLLLAACLVFIGVEISADRRDPKLVRAAQKSEWLRFEDPNKTSGGVA